MKTPPATSSNNADTPSGSPSTSKALQALRRVAAGGSLVATIQTFGSAVEHYQECRERNPQRTPAVCTIAAGAGELAAASVSSAGAFLIATGAELAVAVPGVGTVAGGIVAVEGAKLILNASTLGEQARESCADYLASVQTPTQSPPPTREIIPHNNVLPGRAPSPRRRGAPPPYRQSPPVSAPPPSAPLPPITARSDGSSGQGSIALTMRLTDTSLPAFDSNNPFSTPNKP